MTIFTTENATNTRDLFYLEFVAEDLNFEDWSATSTEIHYGDPDPGHPGGSTYSGTFQYTRDGTSAITAVSGAVTQIRTGWTNFDEDWARWTFSGFSLDVGVFDGSITDAQFVSLIFRGNDTIKGSPYRDDLFGYGGHDRLAGGLGNDTYTVNGGDTVLEAKNAGTDTIKSTVNCTLPANVENLVLLGTSPIFGTGNDQKNTITGNVANNVLKGQGGSDVLVGGLGKDTLYGGKDADVFDFNVLAEIGKTSATRDTIADFGVGNDRISLSTIDANLKVAGNQAFKFIGTQPFHKVAGELHYVRGATTVVSGDVDGDGKADFQLALTGSKTLDSGDFSL